MVPAAWAGMLVLALFAYSTQNQAQNQEIGQPSTQVSAAPALARTTAPAGRYRLDKAHASLTFRVNHLGYSMYTAQFDSFDVTLDFDPADFSSARVEATIDVNSLALPQPPEGFHDKLMLPPWFDAGAYPTMVFTSARVEKTAPDSMRVMGDLTLLGQKRPVEMEVRFNGGYPGFLPFDPNARIGFSARGSLNRSDFGMNEGIPAEGSMMGVSDAVEFFIEAEFNGPPTPPAN